MPKRYLKINFVSHLDPFHYHGGGEQYTRKIIEKGLRRGHKIKIISMKPTKKRLLSKLLGWRKPDLWILFDVFNVPEAKKHFDQKFIDKIILSGNYILGQNAYGDICYLNALPCNGNIGNGKDCVEEINHYREFRGHKSGWMNGYCPINDNKKLFNNALLNIFLSPLHASVFHNIYPATKNKTYILKPLVDVDIFYNQNKKRDIKYASYGGHSEAKGFYNIKDKFPNEEVVFFGSNYTTLIDKFNYGKCLGRIPYHEMPNFLNRVENYIHTPRWPEPNGLIANQAMLCGCNLISNNNVGALTHDFDIADPNEYKNNTDDFWLTVEALLNDN